MIFTSTLMSSVSIGVTRMTLCLACKARNVSQQTRRLQASDPSAARFPEQLSKVSLSKICTARLLLSRGPSNPRGYRARYGSTMPINSRAGNRGPGEKNLGFLYLHTARPRGDGFNRDSRSSKAAGPAGRAAKPPRTAWDCTSPRCRYRFRRRCFRARSASRRRRCRPRGASRSPGSGWRSA